MLFWHTRLWLRNLCATLVVGGAVVAGSAPPLLGTCIARDHAHSNTQVGLWPERSLKSEGWKVGWCGWFCRFVKVDGRTHASPS